MSASIKRIVSCSIATVSMLLLAGCGQTLNSGALAHTSSKLSGSVAGGQQPVSGATIQLYAVGTSGDQSAASALLTSAVKTDANGNFTITGLYTCPSATTPVYLLATGGNPGLGAGTNNSAITLMAALGPCQTLLATNPVPNYIINEVSTVAAVAALQPFMSSPSNVGSGTSDAAGLSAAFTLASEYANTNSAVSPGNFVPVGFAAPSTQINTLANMIAACVNTTGGIAGDGSPCGNLFLESNVPSTPTTVIGALLNIFANPTTNIGPLFSISNGIGAPFQPMLSVPPPNWSVALQTAAPPVTGLPSSVTFTAGAGTATTANIVITNTSSNTVTLAGLTLTGANSSDFYIAGGNCPTSIGASGSCTVTIGFYATSPGTYYADLSIANGGSVTPVFIALTGTAQ